MAGEPRFCARRRTHARTHHVGVPCGRECGEEHETKNPVGLTERSTGIIFFFYRRIQVRQNFIVNGYNGVWSLDHDDGSSYYNDSSNFLIYGGCKNYKGDHKICGPDNVIIHPGIDSRSSGGQCCMLSLSLSLLLRFFSPAIERGVALNRSVCMLEPAP